MTMKKKRTNDLHRIIEFTYIFVLVSRFLLHKFKHKFTHYKNNKNKIIIAKAKKIDTLVGFFGCFSKVAFLDEKLI